MLSDILSSYEIKSDVYLVIPIYMCDLHRKLKSEEWKPMDNEEALWNTASPLWNMYSAYPICNFHVQPATMEKFNIVIKCWQKNVVPAAFMTFMRNGLHFLSSTFDTEK